MRWRAVAVALLLLATLTTHHDHRAPAPRPSSYTQPTVALDFTRADLPPRASRSRSLAATPPAPHRALPRRTVIAAPSFVLPHDISELAWVHSRDGFLVSNCESGDHHAPDVGTRYNGDLHDAGSPTYRGKWQFSWSTWASVGGVGDPAAASEVEQDYRAWLLWRRDGWGQWQCAGIMGVL